MPAGVACFWSYVQADDEADFGRIVSLASQLRAQYRIQTAEDLTLFVDRDSLEWGDEWSKRIDEAIAGTTFFMPVITPSYFKSQPCRRELFQFMREASQPGLEQLLLPVYWVKVPELEADPETSQDEAIRLVSRFQWQDLREVRLEDEDSAIFRKAISALTEELARRAVNVTSTVDDAAHPPASVPEIGAGAAVRRAEAPAPEADGLDDGAPGVLEKLVESEEAMPELTRLMELITGEIERVGEVADQAEQDMTAANRRGVGMRARLVITERFARELAEPTAQIEELGHQYVATLARLDPGMHATLDLAAETPGDDADRAVLLQSIQELASSADSALAQLRDLVDVTKEAAEFSRSLRRPLTRMQTGLQGVIDGRAIIDEWGRRAAAIERDEM